MNTRNMERIKRIAFVAQENKKNELIEWSYFNREILSEHKIIAPVIAGNILEGTLNKPVQKLPSRDLGGFRQLEDLINEEKVDILILFCNPENQMQDKDIQNLLEAALKTNISIAMNATTADFMLASRLMPAKYTISIPAENVYVPGSTATQVH